jgi:uncharacterized protein YijF (DUF1287 family)
MKKTILLFLLIFKVCLSQTGNPQTENPQTEITQAEFSDEVFKLTNQKVTYDPSYFSIDYPNGDVPSHLGVCTDVVIRAYRKVGVDLQKEVHEDMVKNFSAYPQIW